MTTVPAAQYLRVSTERQEYSLDCQSARIANYAQEKGFAVCQTYCDEAKSGLEIGRRTGLSQLLQDVVGGKQSYKAILVYDVSRWGRFQDPDEAAHYEFLCKADRSRRLDDLRRLVEQENSEYNHHKGGDD